MPRIKNTAVATTAKTTVATKTVTPTKAAAKKSIAPPTTEHEWLPKIGDTVLRNYRGKCHEWVVIGVMTKSNQVEGYWAKGDNEDDAEVCSLDDVEEIYVPSVTDVFSMINRYCGLVLDRKLRAFMLTGQSGMGKSEELETALDARGLEFDVDYKIIKGNVSPVALFKMMYDNNGLPLIFDDTDSVLTNATSANIIKAALDSGKRRIVTWASEYKGLVDEGYPKSFEVTSPIIFISNLNPKKLPPAVTGRTAMVNVAFTVEEVLELMSLRQPEMARRHNISNADATKVRLMMTKQKNQILNMSLRTFSLALTVYGATGDMNLVKHQLTTNLSYE